MHQRAEGEEDADKAAPDAQTPDRSSIHGRTYPVSSIIDSGSRREVNVT
jgi:hypothetical protein